MTNFILPDIGEGVKNVIITDIIIKEGQSVKKNDIVIVVESDKASMEIPIDADCTINKILVKNGDKICPGHSILKIQDYNHTDSKSNKKIVSDLSKEVEKNIDSINQEGIVQKNENLLYASPSVRKLARQLDCDLNTIKGSGEKGRILIDDIHNQLNTNESNNIDDNGDNNDTLFNNCSKWGITEKIKLSNIKIITGDRLHKSWNTIPHVTQFDECDITELDKIRKVLKQKNKDKNIKISFIPFFIKAVVKILIELPIFNSSLSNDGKFIYRKKYFNIGIAVNTNNGLVVPVIKNANIKSIKEISHELTALISKAKNKQLTKDDLSGGCITISSLGNIGGTNFTPIINPPEIAILGISKIQIKPWLINNKFKARKILPISISYDHRVIDGVQAAEFTKRFSDYIEDLQN